LRGWLGSAGLDGVRPAQFVAVLAAVAGLGALGGWVLFSATLPALACAGLSVAFPVASHRRRRELRRSAAASAWPGLVDELRILTGAAGRSLPQALFEAGRRAPDELRAGFDAARREWDVSTDFAASLRVLKERLADPTADVVCETLLAAYDIGAANLEARLAALADDRLVDVQHRRDAVARQAGARFARRFVLIVPIGMALVGATIGDGRRAYRTNGGQLGAGLAVGCVALCWWWAGHIMRLPDDQRVFEA
jgi:tight adherence protein B